MNRPVVVIGNFDGVHRGHQALLEHAMKLSDEGLDADSTPLVVVTFWPHPMLVLAPDRAPRLLCDLHDRIGLLRKYGADEVRVVQFTPEIAAWSPQMFVDKTLKPLDPRRVVVGTNFTFGAKAAGNPDTMAELGQGCFEVDALSLVHIDGQRTSSSLIRKALLEGQVELAAEHLGRPLRVRGTVVVGDQRGRLLGFPTANLPVPDMMAVPSDGVYAGWLTRQDDPQAAPLPAAISVGTNPTFDGYERRVESYVLDRDDLELYGVEIAVDFIARLRGQVKFASVDDLVAQLTQDVAQTRTVLGL